MKTILTTALVFMILPCIYGQVTYGNNPAAGQYFNTGDAKIYYEVYGTGPTVVLLHGGIYGYISEFQQLIPVLSKKYRVVAIATRGHGKSELGHQPLSYKLFAEDFYTVIRHITTDSVILIGFSDGADAGYYLASDHPETVKKMVAIGGNFGYTDFRDGDKEFIDKLSAANMERNQQGFVVPRKALMPEPGRFDEFIDEMAALWREKIYVDKERITKIQCETLIAAGQNDGCPVEQYVALFRLLQKGQLAIIPGSDHLVLLRKPELMATIIQTFIK